jgi:YggT family protein
MNSIHFLVSVLFNLYLMVVLLRLWLQLARADFYNPFSQFVVKATQPIVAPLRRVLPSLGSLDTATLVLAILVAMAKVVVLTLMLGGGGFNPLSVFTTSLLIVVKESLSLMFWVLILRAILSWISQGRNPMELVLHQLTEPFLAPIRRIIPPIGGLDLSVLVAIIALQFIQILLQDLLGYYF